MIENPFKSEKSTNELRGYPVSGRLLTVDIEEYWFDPDRRRKDFDIFPITIRAFENTELTQVLNIEADALIALFIDGAKTYTKLYPNGTKDQWVKQGRRGLIRVQGGFGGGSMLAAKDEFMSIARNALRLVENSRSNGDV